MARGFSLPGIWRRSLQFRTVVSTVLVTVLVVGVAGAVLIQRVSNGLLDAKQRGALAEAAAGRSIARSYATSSLESDPSGIIDHLVGDLATRAGKPPAYEVVLGPSPESSDLPSGATSLVSADSVPADLAATVRDQKAQVWMYADINYSDGRAEPGLLVGAPVTIKGIGTYELYYLFPLGDVQRTIGLVRSAIIGVGVALVLTLGMLAWWFSRRLVRPVQQAARTASALATGDLSRRLDVTGEDDMARLAQSFNTMADSIQEQIVRLRRLSEMQRRFVADVSHELRTPLTTIRMAADVLHDDINRSHAESARTSELLVSEVERFDALLSDLLEVSRFDAGEVVLEDEDVDLVVLVRHWVASLQAVAAEHDCEIRLAGVPSCHVDCDPRRIGRVIRNLLVNAVEYGAGQPVEIVVMPVSGYASVTVSDHGVGLDPGDAERVFERFWRADPSRTRTLGGTGLGLAISREDARLHGGDLTVVGERDQGATFTLTLPLPGGGADEPPGEVTLDPVPDESVGQSPDVSSLT